MVLVEVFDLNINAVLIVVVNSTFYHPVVAFIFHGEVHVISLVVLEFQVILAVTSEHTIRRWVDWVP